MHTVFISFPLFSLLIKFVGMIVLAKMYVMHALASIVSAHVITSLKRLLADKLKLE